MSKIPAEVERWQTNIRHGLVAQKKYGRSDQWEKYEDYYLGAHNAGELYMNYMFALNRAMTPQVYFRNPKMVVVPRREDLAAGAPILEAVDNLLIQEMGLKGQLKLASQDNFLYGIYIAKFGYDSEYGFAPEQQMGPVVTPEGVADLSDETATQRGKDFKKIEYNALIQPGMPWVLRWHPRDFVIQPGSTGAHDAQWCAFRFLRHLSDIKEDTKYENTAGLKANLTEEFRSRDEERLIAMESPSGAEAQDHAASHKMAKDDEWVELWEIHDAKTEEIIVISLHYDKFLRKEHDDLQIDGLPFVALAFNRNPRSFWGVPDAHVLQPQQNELNKIVALEEAYRKANLRRLFIREDALVDGEEQRFFSDVPVAIIKVRSEAQSIDDVLKEIQGYIPPDLGVARENVRADMRELLGLGRNQLGEWNRGQQGGASRGTATEATIVQQNASIRVDERRDSVADMLRLIMRRVNQIIFKFWTKERVVRITGPEGVAWKEYTGVALKGEYDYEIEPDDAMPMSRERRRQEAIAVFQMFAQDPYVNPIELRRWVLDQFEGANSSALINPQVAQMLQMMMGGQGESAGGDGANADVSAQVPQMQPGV